MIKEVLEVEDAYLRISAFRMDLPNRTFVQVSAYKDEYHANGSVTVDEEGVETIVPSESLDVYTLSPTIEELGGKENLSMASVYAWLKTQSEFKDAVDC